MNGRPPAPYSREIVAMTAYIAWLSRGAEVGKGFPGQDYVTVRALKPPDKTAGETIYAAQCAACHGTSGAGQRGGEFPAALGPQVLQ